MASMQTLKANRADVKIKGNTFHKYITYKYISFCLTYCWIYIKLDSFSYLSLDGSVAAAQDLIVLFLF
jgi:hypothetical protein